MSKRKRSLSGGFIIFLLTLATFAIIFVAIAVFQAVDFFVVKSDSSLPGVNLTRENRTFYRPGEDELIARDGVLYMDADVLAEHCKYAIAGDKDQKSIVFSDGSYAEFSSGNAFCLNGENCFLENPAFLKNGNLFLPVSFYQNYIKGLHINLDEKKNRIFIEVSSSDYELVAYNMLPERSLSASDYFEVMNTRRGAPTFKLDLSAYEEYMNPSDRDKYLFLVNYENKLDKNYMPERLTDLMHTRKDGRNTQQLDLYAAKAMEAMLKEAAANGYTSLSITSGYRSYNYQQVLFNNQVSALRASYGADAEKKATEAVALPGTSEHQSGLCADLHNLPSASQHFANTKEYQWLVENCAKFGFILRYPKNKTDITKIMFEPWHYRYVGRYHAERIMQEGLCLEEYMAFIGSDNE